MATIEEWLTQLGLQRYAPAFAEAEVDLETLRLLSEDDLKEIGLPIGPRRRILAQLAAADPAPAANAPVPVLHTAAPERRQITVMFVDLVGSTEMSTRVDPEVLGESLAAYKAAVAAEITHAGGTIAKYLGDGVLAYFGWPQAHEDAAAIAIRCALAAQGEVARLRDPEGRPMQTRIGLATGLVVVGGTTGTGTASEDTIAGEVLNLAARLQSLALPDTVVVSGGTRAQVGRLFEMTSLGAQLLKGFEAPVEAWAVTREAAHTNRFAAARPIRCAFIGREQERQALLERWHEARQGHGRAVLLLGEAGIGKSRLVEALHNEVTGEAHGTIGWQCSSFHQTKALYPVIDYLGHAAEILDGDPPPEKLRKLAALLAPVHMGPSLPLFALLLAIPPGAGYAEPALAPAQRRAATIAALADWLRRIAETHPLLLVLEDAHWADATTLELMTRVIATIGNTAALALVTGRPEFTSPWGGRSHVSIIGLDRLGLRASEDLVRAIADAGAVDEATLREIVARGEGNPLFLEELSVAVRGAVSAARQSIPETLQSSLMGRLDHLGDAKETAQICAVLGRRFARPLLELVAGGPAALLDVNLSQLVANDIVVPIGRASEGRFEFRHALVRDAAHESLLLSQRRRLHERCGRHLEEQFAEVARTEPELLAYHFAEADLPEQASGYFEAAGDRAAADYSYAEAIASYRDAIRQNDRLAADEDRDRRELRLLLKLGPALTIIQGVQHRDVDDAYTRAEALGRAIDDVDNLFKAVWGRWYHANISRDQEGAQHHAQELVGIAERSGDDNHLLEALHCRWSSALFRGDCGPSIADCRIGIERYRADEHHALAYTFGGHDPGVCAHCALGQNLMLSGAIGEARVQLERGIALAESLGHPASVAHSVMVGLASVITAQDAAAATRLGERLAAIAERYNFPPQRIGARFSLAWAEAQASGSAEALARMRADFASVTALGPMTLMYVTMFVEQLQRAGHADEALGVADEQRARLRIADTGMFVPDYYRVRAECLARLGRRDEATADFRRAATVAQAQHAHLLAIRSTGSWLRAGGGEEARAGLARALAAVADEDAGEIAAARRLLAAHDAAA